jgi:tetratricopeptide (TPR) repeat protein
MTRLSTWILGLFLALPTVAAPLSCLWDRDTLEQERARFPSALELLTGHFPRHSEAYYRWRIADREARMGAGERSPELYDDLAVAWSKLGDDARAIALMDEKEAGWPGLYETAANRGTFLIHSGQYEEGAAEVARAIEINPQAHFGREVYQELLVRYVLEVRGEEDALTLPMQPDPKAPMYRAQKDFWSFVREARGVPEGGDAEEAARAVRGVLGMMRFGNYDSPVLCEALSDLLLADWNHDAKRLAARALLMASYRVEDEGSRSAYRDKAAATLMEQTPTPRQHRGMTLEELEHSLAQELEAARRYSAELEAREREWIENGDDVDALFAATFLVPESQLPGPREATPPALLIAGAAGLLCLAYVLARTRRRARS